LQFREEGRAEREHEIEELHSERQCQQRQIEEMQAELEQLKVALKGRAD